MRKQEAVFKLHPNVVTIQGDKAFDAEGNPVVYDEAVVQAEMNANVYKTQRAQAYPTIADQLDLLYHGGMDAWKAAIEAIKLEYPKP
jgi:methyl coenzyme M reductase subunit C-like uncharacterized protein (methanogenesis marker protein 7)